MAKWKALKVNSVQPENVYNKPSKRVSFRVILSATGCAILALLFVVIVRAVLVQDVTDYLTSYNEVGTTVDTERTFRERAPRLAKALSIPTISWDINRQETQAFLDLHDFIFKSFPLIHNSRFVSVEVVNNYSLLYTIQGKENEPRVPYILAAHLDVVPAEPEYWQIDPFGGKIVDNVIWGRGALDDKQSFMGVLEALEFLLENDFQPRRTFYLAFGHDEEVQGLQGAGHIVELLKQRGIKEVDFVLDEGSVVTKDIIKGVDRQVAAIGVAEKGYLTLEMRVEAPAGHSSMPPKESALGILATAVGKLEKRKQPTMFGTGPEYDLFRYLAPHAVWTHRLLFANLWLFAPIISRALSAVETTDGLVRTTTAVTVFNSGLKSNVVPGLATAVVNHRTHPGQSLENVLAHDRVAMDDERVTIHVKEHIPASNISPYGPQASAFNVVAVSIQQVYPDAVIIPTCTVANTDLKHYIALSTKLYRLSPFLLNPKTRTQIHGHNEHISIADYHKVINFYVNIITNSEKSESYFKVPEKTEL